MLNALKKISRKKRKRRGRGVSSGVGGTSGRGNKGERSRAGKKISPWFEGGQTPLYRRLPKRGFKNPVAVDYEILNICDLNRFDDGTVISEEYLYDKGLIKMGRRVKILGKGGLNRKLTIEGIRLSSSAKDKIEAAGGSVVLETVEEKQPKEETEKGREKGEEGVEKKEKEEKEEKETALKEGEVKDKE